MSNSRDRLSRSQELYMSAMEGNQAALIDRIEQIFRPIEQKVDELAVQLEAMSRQIEQLHERQEAQEAALKLERSA